MIGEGRPTKGREDNQAEKCSETLVIVFLPVSPFTNTRTVITLERINTTFLIIVDTIFKRGEEVFQRTKVITNRLKIKRAKGTANLPGEFPEEGEPNPLLTTFASQGPRNRSGEI